MKKILQLTLFSLLVVGMSACLNDDGNTQSGGTRGGSTADGDWLIPRSQVRDGGPGKDGIPSIDNPIFSSIEEIDFLSQEDLVLALRVGEEVRVYPHPILDWHEIINDDIGDKSIAITYCPLTGTGVGWNRVIEGKTTTFGVSGLLYNSNLIPYDRETDSNWSQMRLDCVNGELIGRQAETYQLFETTWATVKKMFPQARVVTTETGFARNYNLYPYGTYRTDDNLIFPVGEIDDSLHPKERVLGVIAINDTRAYPLEAFGGAKVIQENFGGKSFVIIGSQTDNYMMAYDDNFPSLEFSSYSDPDDASIVMQDNEGNTWDVFGLARSGPRAGTQLKSAQAFIGYWFSWAAFYENIDLR